MTKQRTPAQERAARRRHARAVEQLARVYRHWQPTPAFFAYYRAAVLELRAAERLLGITDSRNKHEEEAA